MKYFSLKFSLTPKDYAEFDKRNKKGLFILRLKKLIIPYVLLFALSFFYNSLDLFLILSVLLIITGLVIPEMINSEFVKVTRNKTKLTAKPMTVDFYSDHFVVKNEADEEVKSHSERHYGFDIVAGVEESAEYFYFIFKVNTVLVIPKRILNEESFNMIKNLIENLFKKNYRVI